ncbi:MAG: hypothetical protein ACOYJQ_07650 [Pseudochelatococcus sp.]|uniref:hypothetical protein n=1 Tax=Pseudochelatococcus sp. TaxID=2020869 RepID=UPI003D94C97D
MNSLTTLLAGVSALTALTVAPVLAQGGAEGNCIAVEGAASSRPVSGDCRGGPLKPGDSRLGKAQVPRPADRQERPGHTFRIGGSTVTISGSVRVEGIYSQ